MLLLVLLVLTSLVEVADMTLLRKERKADGGIVRAGDATIDVNVNPELIKTQSSKAAAAVAAVVGVHHTSVHVLAGSGVTVRSTIEVDDTLRVSEAYEIAKQVRLAIKDVEHVDSADIHLELKDGSTTKF